MTSLAATAPPPSTRAPSFVPSYLLVNEKTGMAKHKPARLLPRYRYWEPNAHQTLWLLVADLDHDDSLLRLFQAVTDGAPMPSYVIEKGSNGHAQAGWAIEHVSTGATSRRKPYDYAQAVRRALTAAVSGDPAFTNGRCWNPHWSGWAEAGRVMWGPTAPRSLGSLRAELEAAGLWQPAPATRGPVRAPEAHGRNVHVFDAARLRMGGTVADAAHAANDALAVPLRPAELAGIIRSIERWEARTGRRGGAGTMSDEERARQAERGRKGGKAGTTAQKAARARGPAAAAVVRNAEAVGRAAQARRLRDAGFTAQQIADRMKCSRRTVFRLLSSP